MNKQSVAIYNTVKISTTQIRKRVQSEAKVADLFIEDVETKFEYMLFNAPKEVTYLDLFIHFRSEWERIMKALDKRKFKYIRVNRNHFDNLYAPIV